MKSTTASLALLGCLGLNLAKQANAAGLDVQNPGDVVLGNQITIKWDSIGQNRFDIVLFADDFCEESQVADLCGKSNGCSDSAGDYNVVVPDSVGDGQCELRFVRTAVCPVCPLARGGSRTRELRC